MTTLESPTTPASQLWLVRHGETEWSAAHRHTSRTDLDLVDAGVTEARGVVPRLAGASFARVISSPRLRARRTARIVGYADPEVIDDLREWDYGDDEGRTTEDIRVERPGWSVWTQGPAGGETQAEVGARADRVVELARRTGAPVLAFSHGHFCRVLGARWLGLGVSDGAHLALSTASVSVLGWEREVPAILHWNDTGALS